MSTFKSKSKQIVQLFIFWQGILFIYLFFTYLHINVSCHYNNRFAWQPNRIRIVEITSFSTKPTSVTKCLEETTLCTKEELVTTLIQFEVTARLTREAVLWVMEIEAKLSASWFVLRACSRVLKHFFHYMCCNKKLKSQQHLVYFHSSSLHHVTALNDLTSI